MATLYIGIILLCRVVQSLFEKKSSDLMRGTGMFLTYGGYRQCVSALLALGLIAAARSGFRIDGTTAALSAFSGVMLVIAMFCSLYAMKSGTMPLVSLFGTAGLLVPCIAGIFLFDIPIAPLQWAGVGLFLFASFLMIGASKKLFGGFTVKTLFLLIGNMLSNGCTMLAQQMFTAYAPEGDVSMFSFLSFGLVGVALLIAAPVYKKAANAAPAPMPRPLLLYGLLLSAAVLTINQLATKATALVEPVILFTFINGGATVISVVVAAIVFKEKQTARGIAGALLGVAALVAVKAFA